MLMISRRPAEGVCIGADIRVLVLGFHDRKVRIGIQAPPELELQPFSERPCGDPLGPVHRDGGDSQLAWFLCDRGQGVWIGDRIFVLLHSFKGRQARFGIGAPDEIGILRDELVAASDNRLETKDRAPLRMAERAAV